MANGRRMSRTPRTFFALLAVLLLGAGYRATAKDWADGVSQMVLSIAPDWNSSKGRLQLFQREGKGWKAVSAAVPVLYGRNGLAWGRGVLDLSGQTGPQKVERDKRAPAGVFRIGTIYTFDSQLPAGASYPFHTIGLGDAWIDDPTNPLYNQHVVVDPANPPAWFESQKMRHNDPPHRWLVEIRHNADPPMAGAGSAIFFHIRRGVDRPSAGCTVMSEDSIVQLIRWLNSDAHPHYVLLPREEYTRVWKKWGLPTPEEAAALLP